MTLRIVLAEDLHLSAGVPGLFTKEGSARIRLAVIAQLRGGDGCPAGLLHRIQCGFFGIGVPGNAGNHALGIGAANQRRDQGCRQTCAETVVLITGGKAVIEVVIGIQRDCHRVGKQRFGVCCAEVFVVVYTHGYCLSLFVGIVRDSSRPGRLDYETPRSIQCSCLNPLRKHEPGSRKVIQPDAYQRHGKVANLEQCVLTGL
ncbi:hypothetical protein D3C80_1027870 [compost metagenome]